MAFGNCLVFNDFTKSLNVVYLHKSFLGFCMGIIWETSRNLAGSNVASLQSLSCCLTWIKTPSKIMLWFWLFIQNTCLFPQTRAVQLGFQFAAVPAQCDGSVPCCGHTEQSTVCSEKEMLLLRLKACSEFYMKSCPCANAREWNTK